MLEHLRRIVSQTAIYGIGDAVTRIASLFLLPLYTRLLTPDDFGKLTIATLCGTLAALILDFGQRTALFRFYFDTEDTLERRRLTGTVIIFLLTTSATTLLVVLVLFHYVVSQLTADVIFIFVIKITLIATFFDVASIVPYAVFRAKQYAGRYVVLSVSRLFVNICSSIIAVVILRRGITGLVYANLITAIIFFVVSIILSSREIAWTVDFRLLGRLLRFGVPLVPASLAYWTLNLSDRFFLQKYTDLKQVAIYAVSYAIAAVLPMVMGWFNTAYAPYCFSMAKEVDAPRIHARIVLYAVTFMTIFGLGLSLLSREAIVLLTPPTYYRAASIVPLIVLSYIFYEVYYLFSFGFDLTRRTGRVPLIIASGAVINVLLNVLLIPRFGMLGAALATVFSYALLPIIEFPIVRKLYPTPYDFRRLFKLFIVSIGIYLLGVTLKTGRLSIDVAMGIGLMIGWGVLLWALRFFPASELLAARTVVRESLRTFSRSFQ